MARRNEVLGLAVAAFFGTMVARIVISPVVPDVIDAFDVTTAQVGLALSGMWAAYALLQFPSGVLAERYGERRLVLAGLGLTGLASVLLAAAPSFPAFVAVVVFLGTGAGLYFTPATALLTARFERTGLPLGVHSTGEQLAGLAAPVAAAATAVRYGWRPALLLGAAVALPIAALIAWRVERTPPTRPDASLLERLDPALLAGVLRRPPVAYTMAVGVLCYFSWQAYASFFPTFLVVHLGVDPGRASALFGGAFAVAVVGLPVLGRLSDRVGRDAALAIVFLATAGGYGVFLLGPRPGPLAAAVGVGLLGLGLSWSGVLHSRFMDHFSAAERGTAFGMVRTLGVLLGSTGSVVTGTLADVAGWPVAYGAVAGLLLLGTLALGLNRGLGLDL